MVGKDLGETGVREGRFHLTRKWACVVFRPDTENRNLLLQYCGLAEDSAQPPENSILTELME